MLLFDKENKINSIIASGMLGVTLLVGAVLAGTPVNADEEESVVSNVSVKVTTSCTFQGIANTAHTASVENGRVQGNIGSTTLKAFCNDNGGFSIHAIGYTGEEYGNTVLTSQTIGTSADIATGTGTSGTSSWAMKLDASNSTAYPITLDNGFGAYSAVPATFTKVAHRDSGTDTGTSATGANLTTTYQVYVSSDQPADNYVGKVKYTMVHPASEVPTQPYDTDENKIGYYPNASGVADTMGDQSASASASVTLWASNFQRPGYGFAGWNTEFDMSGTNYGPNETITTPSDLATTGLSLYANWIKSAGTMQGWTGCSSMSTGDITALTDSRDNSTYAVAKLADGKCWMIENLRLDNTAELTTTNTNNPLATDGTVTLLNTDGTTTNHLSASTNPTTTAWCTTNSSACDDQSMLYTGNTADATANMTGSGVNIYSYGNYYNWYSATAGNGTYSKSSGNTGGDLCPTGWHLPTGKDASGDFGVLDIALGGTGSSSSSSTTPTGVAMSAAWRSWPNNFVYSGAVNGSSVYNRGSYGYYWSSTAYSSSNAYALVFLSSYVYPGTGGYSKYYGGSVRCVAPAS